MSSKPTYEELLKKIAVLESKIHRNTKEKEHPHELKSLRASKEMLQLVMDNIPQFIFWKDRNSVYLGCNRNFAIAAGVGNPMAIRGKTDHDLAWKKKEADFFVECDKRVMDSDTPEYHIIEPQLQAGGHQAWLDTNKIPLHNSKGNVVGILGTYEDITERKKTQETLELYEKIVATTKDLMTIIDCNCVYLAVNDAMLDAYGKKRDEIVGSTVEDLLGTDAFERWAQPNLEKAFSGKEVTFDTWADYPRRGKRYMRITYYPYFNKTNNCTGVVGNAQDITLVRDLEQKLVQSQKMEAIGTLAGGIAHDFNNILGGIMGYAKLAELHLKDHQKVQGYLHAIEQASNRAAAVVRQILTFSKQSESQKIPTDVGFVTKEALQLIRASIPATVAISTNIRPNVGLVMADQTQIHQIVMNLCTNAFQAMGSEGGRIEVGLETARIRASDLASYPSLKPGRYLRLTVADTGKGMAPEDIARIFDPYFTTKEIGEGTGLGLATVHGIIKDHKGEIKVYSELGIGTTFHVLLPLIEFGDRETNKAVESLATGDELILFVDDERSLVEIGKELLEELGYRVETHTSPMEALKAFQSNADQYDIIISDLTMPEMTGDKLAREIKKIRKDIPFVLCTGFSQKRLYETTMEMDIQHLLMKPLNMENLATTIRSLLDEGKTQADNS